MLASGVPRASAHDLLALVLAPEASARVTGDLVAGERVAGEVVAGERVAGEVVAGERVAGKAPADGRAGTAASRVLDRFGTLREAGRATPAEVEALLGVDAAAAARLAAALELGRRAAAEDLPRGLPFRSSRDIYDRYRPLLLDARRERFVAVMVDAKNRVLREEAVSEGILTTSLVHPREVFAPAIREGAAGLVLAHNHPSGDPEPSPDDVDITARLVAAGELIGIRVLDHVVVGERSYVSFLDRGWIR